MSAFPAMALAIALTYVVGDLYRPTLGFWLSVPIDLVLCFVIFRVSNKYLKALKE